MKFYYENWNVMEAKKHLKISRKGSTVIEVLNENKKCPIKYLARSARQGSEVNELDYCLLQIINWIESHGICIEDDNTQERIHYSREVLLEPNERLYVSGLRHQKRE